MVLKIEFLQALDVDAALQNLIAEHEEFHWAVAWGSLTGTAKKLLKHPGRFKDVTFGIAFSQTHPDLIDKLVGVKGAKVVAKFPGGTYHPKIYAFKSGDQAAAIVGSANFTFGGLGNNHEAAVLVVTGTVYPIERRSPAMVSDRR